MASPSRKNPVASFRDQLLDEEPKIDAALKSFCSWLVSSATVRHLLTADDGEPAIVWTLSNALPYTRHLSKAINAHIVPIQYDDKRVAPMATPQTLMKETAARVWNDMAAQPGTRLTKVLGRTALRYVWHDLDWQLTSSSSSSLSSSSVLGDTREGQQFVELFAKLLMDQENALSDTALVWGGPHVLAQRASQRLAVAAERTKEQQETLRVAVSPMIEELPPDDEEEIAAKDESAHPSNVAD